MRARHFSIIKPFIPYFFFCHFLYSVWICRLILDLVHTSKHLRIGSLILRFVLCLTIFKLRWKLTSWVFSQEFYRGTSVKGRWQCGVWFHSSKEHGQRAPDFLSLLLTAHFRGLGDRVHWRQTQIFILFGNLLGKMERVLLIAVFLMISPTCTGEDFWLSFI